MITQHKFSPASSRRLLALPGLLSTAGPLAATPVHMAKAATSTAPAEAKETTIHERIDKLIYHFSKGNKSAFGRLTGILPGVLAGMVVGGRESKPGFEILQKMLAALPQVSAKWLILGQGPMLLSDSAR